ncbi:MAG TPA: DnaJ domain-containing protein [Candidatus Limnocylindria bacterium]|nr:DnaJ domain-containing protein [Candidatus Limnocylindria bacterium]
MPSATAMRSEARDFYEVLGAEPSASAAQLRAAFREAVLRHHPDRAPSSEVATRRTSVLNRAWAELRDPVRRLHYDHALESGSAATLDWPLDEGEAARRPRPSRRRIEPGEPSPWHQPQWRSVAGFRVPADVFMAGPVAQERWIVEHHIADEDWRNHHERYWLRYAARHYAERGRVDDWLGALERMVEQEPPLAEIIDAGLREAYIAAGEELRGAMVVAGIGDRYPDESPQRRWADRELRVLLGEYRDRHVRRGPAVRRAENAELLLNFLESIGLEPSFTDYRAAIVAHRRARHPGRAAELVERVMAAPVPEPGRWFSLVQMLTEAGQLDRASELLASIARGDHPDALDPRRVHGPWRRISAARERLARARRRGPAAHRTPAASS